MKRNNSPGWSAWNPTPPLGCQKLSSSMSGRPARKWNQSKSVTPTEKRITPRVDRPL